MVAFSDSQPVGNSSLARNLKILEEFSHFRGNKLRTPGYLIDATNRTIVLHDYSMNFLGLVVQLCYSINVFTHTKMPKGPTGRRFSFEKGSFYFSKSCFYFKCNT